MKVLGWLAVAISVLSVLFGLSPVLIAILSGDEAWRQGGWALMFATVPIGISRGAAGPALLGIIGIIGAIVIAIASGVMASSSSEVGEQVLGIGLILAIVAFLAGLIGTIWAGFAARPRA